jgi:hypothetical protein
MIGEMTVKKVKQQDRRNARTLQGMSADPADIGADPNATTFAEYGVINPRYSVLNLNFNETPAVKCKSQLDHQRRDQMIKANDATQEEARKYYIEPQERIKKREQANSEMLERKFKNASRQVKSMLKIEKEEILK